MTLAAPLSMARCHTRRIIGCPPIIASGLPGSRSEA
jgi:hypothetical protein